MRTKVTLVLLFLNVALFFFIFRFERGWQTERAQAELRTFVLGPEAARLTRLDISGPAVAEPVALARTDAGWQLTLPIAWPANTFAVERILADLARLEGQPRFSVAALAGSGQSLADYGLDAPRLTLDYTTAAGTDESLRIGSDTADLSRIYVLSPDGQWVHVVGRSITASLTQGVDALRDPSIFATPDYEVRELRITGGSPLGTQVRREGERWQMGSPVTARASRLATRTLLADLNGLRVNRFIASPPTGAFPNNGYSLRVTLEGNNRVENVRLGNPTGATSSADTTEFYARKETGSGNEDNTQVFTVQVPSGLLRTLQSAQVDLRERRILPDLMPQSVTGIALGNAETLIELQRLEPTAAGGAGRTAWRLIMRGGATPADAVAADEAAIQALLDRLTTLSATEFASDAPTRGDLEDWGLISPTTVTLTLAPAAGGAAQRVELRLGGDRGSSAAYARIGEIPPYVYRVDPALFNYLSLDRNVWRDKLLRELAAGERITAVEILDLTTNVALASETYPVEGGASAGTTNLARFAALLRSLRARAFVSDMFDPGGVATSGVTRPWRYRVSIRVNQVAGATGTQQSTQELYLTERLGGGLQRAGVAAYGVFDIEQPLIDAFSRVVDAPRDPGPPSVPASP
jgi:hypothetical protein